MLHLDYIRYIILFFNVAHVIFTMFPSMFVTNDNTYGIDSMAC